MTRRIYPNDFSREELSAAFSKVQNPNHWKDSIYSIIDAKDKEVVARAIPYFTATEPTFTDIGNGQLLVRADGYRRGPAGDH
jgi:hypothetical protein